MCIQKKYILTKYLKTKYLRDNIRSKFITGVLEDNVNDKLSGVEKKAWLHISKFRDDDIEPQDIFDHIKKRRRYIQKYL